MAPPDDSKFTPVQKILLIDIIKDESNAVKKALSKLALLFVDEDEADDNRAIAERVGGASILSAVLRNWYAFPSIQAEGCRALQNMSCNNTDLLGPIKDSGGLDAIIWAMNTYADNQNVQTTACGTLSNLFIEKDTSDYLVEELDGFFLERFVELLCSMEASSARVAAASPSIVAAKVEKENRASTIRASTIRAPTIRALTIRALAIRALAKCSSIIPSLMEYLSYIVSEGHARVDIKTVELKSSTVK